MILRWMPAVSILIVTVHLDKRSPFKDATFKWPNPRFYDPRIHQVPLSIRRPEEDPLEEKSHAPAPRLYSNSFDSSVFSNSFPQFGDIFVKPIRNTKRGDNVKKPDSAKQRPITYGSFQPITVTQPYSFNFNPTRPPSHTLIPPQYSHSSHVTSQQRPIRPSHDLNAIYDALITQYGDNVTESARLYGNGRYLVI